MINVTYAQLVCAGLIGGAAGAALVIILSLALAAAVSAGKR